MTNWQLVIHGDCGAMRLSAEEEAAGLAGLDNALDAGQRILESGGSALDAVEGVMCTATLVNDLADYDNPGA